MDELRKIARIVHQQAEGCALEVLLALDATTGQNAVNQAKQFNEVADITGIILTKLDGTAKGGIIISIADDLKVPVKLVGVGEKLDDLQPFSTTGFIDALFMDDVEFESNYERLIDEEENLEIEQTVKEKESEQPQQEFVDDQQSDETLEDVAKQVEEQEETLVDVAEETEEQSVEKKSKSRFLRFPFRKKGE